MTNDEQITITFDESKELLIRAGKNGFNSYEHQEVGLEYYDAEVDALWIIKGLNKERWIN